MSKQYRILFVDNNPDELEKLFADQFRSLGAWDPDFVGSADEAFEFLGAEPFDALVSGVQVGDVNVKELLWQARERFPLVLRVIAAEPGERSSVLRTSDFFHLVLTKPLVLDILAPAIERLLNVSETLNNQGLKKLMSNMKTLPSLPTIYTEMMEELRSGRSTSASIASVVEKDMALASKTLKLANSSYFSVMGGVTNLEQAITLIGVNNLKAIVMSNELFSSIKPSRQKFGFKPPDLWRHSLNVAGCARQIARKEGANIETIDHCFLAGLLHDTGMLVLMHMLTTHFKVVLGFIEKKGLSYLDAENEMFGFSHADIGAYLMDMWGLPAPVVEAIAFHHTPRTAGISGFSPLMAVHYANVHEETWGEDTPLDLLGSLDTEWVEESGFSEKIPVWEKICNDVQRDV